jgi:hypothetical protein
MLHANSHSAAGAALHSPRCRLRQNAVTCRFRSYMRILAVTLGIQQLHSKSSSYTQHSRRGEHEGLGCSYTQHSLRWRSMTSYLPRRRCLMLQMVPANTGWACGWSTTVVLRPQNQFACIMHRISLPPISVYMHLQKTTSKLTEVVKNGVSKEDRQPARRYW